ncbi:MAG: LacI family transcriptional regulator [Siculibacillus sp.]|nr:LacI family transcriptional regulator [Siculibacillus sp.]
MSLRYIAASLGLSVTTVSRALAGYSDVAEETRRRVKAEAERIGYVPNAIARRLQKGRTDAVGVVAPAGSDAISDAYLYTAIISAWGRLSELDRDLVMLPSNSNGGRGSESRMLRRAVEERRVDGLLLLRTRRDDWRLPYLRAANFPFVVFGARHEDMPDVTAIGIDDEMATDEVLARLAAFSHRRVALIAPDGEYAFADSRKLAFAERAAAHGLQLLPITAEFSEDGGRAVTSRLLSMADHPTAFVYFANRMALGGLLAISDSILVPGRHVSVISYGDNPNLLYASPPVTAVRAPVEAMMRHAVDVLIGEIEGKPVEPIRCWAPTLVRRQSDGPRTPDPGAGSGGTSTLETPVGGA